MTGSVQSVSSILFREPGTNVFAVLDGASIPDLLDHLYANPRPEFECLYTGELEPDLAETAPYLVRIAEESEFTSWLLGQGWGKHWGIFILTQADFKTLRKHLRRFLIVYDSDARSLYFRYYDPRVLRTYLPTCNQGELAEFFGPVAAFVLEDEPPAAALRCELSKGALATRKEPVAAK